MVQAMKLSLRKTLLNEHRSDSDIYLPYVAMGYRMTKQASTGYSPYYLLYGRHPIFQAKIQAVEHDPFPEALNELPKFIVERSELLE